MQQNLYLKKFAAEILFDAAAFFQCNRLYLYYWVLFTIANFICNFLRLGFSFLLSLSLFHFHFNSIRYFLLPLEIQFKTTSCLLFGFIHSLILVFGNVIQLFIKCISLNFYEFVMKFNFIHNVTKVLDANVSLEIFQAGQESFRSIMRSYYKGAIGALLVYDITRYYFHLNLIIRLLIVLNGKITCMILFYKVGFSLIVREFILSCCTPYHH